MKTISIGVNLRKDPSCVVLRRFLDEIFTRDDVCVNVSSLARRTLTGHYPRVNFVGDEELYGESDLFLVFGGDGAVIRSAVRLAARNTPILGVNLGRVGYLTQIEPDSPKLIHRFFDGQYQIEHRMMLDSAVERCGMIIKEMPAALNDCVISNGTVSRMVDVALRCNGYPVMTCHSDGVIAATPTGSTAYSMSAGGPVLAPTMDCICLTPVCPHSLSSRPLVVPGNSRVAIENQSIRERNAYLSVDGAQNFRLLCGDIVHIMKSSKKTSIVRVDEGGFFDALHRKLRDSV